MKGKAIIFSAPSGAGKTTIVHHLLERDLGLAFSVSATSRLPRQNEKEGVDYYFKTPEEFRSLIEKGAFLEYEEVYRDHYYGTLYAELERISREGKHIVFDVDVVGGINIKSRLGDRALAIFVQPPSMEILEQRLRKRSTEDPDKIRIRLEKAREEMDLKNQFDLVLVNEILEQTLVEAEAIVRNFIGRPHQPDNASQPAGTG